MYFGIAARTMLAHAQELIYRLTELMPTQYQKDNKDSDAGIILAGTRASVT